ncbi:ribonuclease HII [bacterium]|nr:ribonuclease HII [bacterium]
MRIGERERELIRSGLVAIAGCDEAGRGALAGPVVAAAVVLDYQSLPEGIADSKQLSAAQRRRAADSIRRCAIASSLAAIDSAIIDRDNILNASLAAMNRAVASLGIRVGHVLVDGNRLPPANGIPTEALVKGDSRALCIAAASILAKVERDAILERLADEYKGYGFELHKGYPTSGHLETLRRLGPCPVHRRSYAPVRELLQEDLFGK